MAKCKLCTNTNAKYLLENARHLTSEKVCLDCYQTFNEDTNQTHLFQEDTNTPMSYDQFLEIYPKLGYEKIADFSQEIGISANTPSTTWKKKGEVPYLVKYFLESKLNKVESKVEIENNIDKNDYYELCSKYRELKHKYDLYILKNSNDPTEKAHAAYLGDPFKDLVDANKRNKELKKEIGTLKMDENELIQTVYAIKKGIFYMYHQKNLIVLKIDLLNQLHFLEIELEQWLNTLKDCLNFMILITVQN